MTQSPQFPDQLGGSWASALERRTVLKAGAAASLALFLAACNGSSQTSSGTKGGAPKRGGTLTWAGDMQVKTLDPAFSTITTERNVYYAVCETLTTLDPVQNIKPGLATSWKLEGNDLVFTLQTGVKFHDGTDFDAEAVKFNLDRLMDPKTNSPLRGQLVPPVKSVEVVDQHTVKLVCDAPWRPLLAALGGRARFIQSPTALKASGPNSGKLVGTGPYELVGWDVGKKIEMKRFEGYRDKKRNQFDKIVMLAVSDPNTQISMLRAGTANLVDNLTPQLLATVKGVSGLATYSKDVGSWEAVQVNMSKSPFDRKELREALALATDREGVKKIVFLDEAALADQPVRESWATNKDLKYPFGYDLKRAKSLAETLNIDDELVLTIPNRARSEAIGEVVFEGYRKLGLNVSTAVADAASWYADVVSGKTPWTVIRWVPYGDPDVLMRMLYHSDSTGNSIGFNDPEVDALLDKAAQEFDQDKALPMYEELADKVVAAAPYAFVVGSNICAGSSNDLSGVEIYADLALRFPDMYFTG